MDKSIRRGHGALLGVGIVAVSIGIGGCCVRPETIADTLRMQDAAATAELCDSLDLSRESARMQEECGNAYLMLNTERIRCEEECGSGYEPVWR